jgi:ankyrin repeat protein
MYTRVLDEISSGDEYARKVALECFRWIMYAKQTPSLDVLRVTVTLLESPRTVEDLKLRLPPRDYIVEECRNLLQPTDFGTSRTKFYPIHFSFLEYLENLPIDKLQGTFWISLADRHDAENVLSCRCMEWLSLALPEHLGEPDFVDAYTHLSYPTQHFDKHAISAIDRSGKPSADLLESVNRLLCADVDKLDSLVKLRLMGMPSGQMNDVYGIDVALSRNYLLWISDLYLIPGLNSEWIELEVPKYGLHLAVWFRPEGLPKLLSNGYFVDELDLCQRTPLSHACAKGCSASVDALLHAGARLDADSWRISPLGLAIQKDHFELTKTLLKVQADTCDLPDVEGHIPLMMATSLRMVQLLCEACDFDMNATDRVGRSVLAYYVGVDMLDRYVPLRQVEHILEYLHSRGADLYAKSEAGMSLVDYAVCRANGDEPLKYLLQRASILIDREANEWTSLHWACSRGNFQMAKILLEHGSKVKKITTLQPHQSWTPYEILLHYREVLRDVDDPTTYALGRSEEIGTSANLLAGEQIKYSSFKATGLQRQTRCSLCEMQVRVCNIAPGPPSRFLESDQC